ncbi:N-methyl-L-tryptophan oxidase [soil metagenome]
MVTGQLDQMATSKHFDVIVAGCGGMGSATAYHLGKRGQSVLGLERFDIPHAMGSSHGVNRIIRLAYYEDPSYVPLLRRAYELWRDLEREAGEQLLSITGSIDASAPDGEVFQGSLRSCKEHDISHEVLSSHALTERFPGYKLPSGHMAVFQQDGGFLLSERCIVAHVHGALKAGAELHGRERVLEWHSNGDSVTVRTSRSTYQAARLVLTAGAWMDHLVPVLAPLLQPERQVLAWFQPHSPQLFGPDLFPVFNLTVEEGRYYGFPVYGIPGFKVGRYHHLGEYIDPETMDREPNDHDEAVLRTFTERYFPGASGPVMTMTTCIFTNTPDEHFIIDSMPGAPNVIVVSPCSGHGFKFSSVIGEIIADLAIQGDTGHDLSLFALDRFAS